jgi:hypothetical protein
LLLFPLLLLTNIEIWRRTASSLKAAVAAARANERRVEAISFLGSGEEDTEAADSPLPTPTEIREHNCSIIGGQRCTQP